MNQIGSQGGVGFVGNLTAPDYVRRHVLTSTRNERTLNVYYHISEKAPLEIGITIFAPIFGCLVSANKFTEPV